MNAQIKAAEALCAELGKLEQKVRARVDAAARKLADSEADERKHAERLTAAEEAYAAEPTDKNAGVIAKAGEALNLAKLRVRAPRAEHEVAQAEFAAWQSTSWAAEASLHDETLRHRASLAEYNRRTAGAFRTLLGALAAVRNAAAELDEAFDDANAAARELGEPELSVFHRIAPLLRSAASVHGADGLVNSGNFYKAAGTCAHGLVKALPFPLLDRIEVHARDRGVVRGTAASELLECVLACRTSGEGDELIRAAEKGASPPAPEPDRSAWLAEQERFRRQRGDDRDDDDKRHAADGPLGDAEEFKRVAAEGLAMLPPPPGEASP